MPVWQYGCNKTTNVKYILYLLIKKKNKKMHVFDFFYDIGTIILHIAYILRRSARIGGGTRRCAPSYFLKLFY